jgi:signal transduction histidine kinase
MQLSRSFFFALLLACLQFCGCSSVKQDGSPSLIEAQDWLIDTSGKATLEDVMSSTNWTSMSGWESWGFGSESIWVRIKLRAATEDNQTSWSMRIRPAVLDYVTLYDPATNSVLRTGDALPLDPDDEMASIVFTLPVSSLPKERTIYLNVTTTSARTLNIEVLPAGYAQHLNRLQEWGMGFATVVSAVFAFWALGQWLTSREKVIGAFAVKQIISTLWSFFILGFARILIGEQPPEGVLSTISSMILFWLIATTLWFYVALLQLYRASPLLLRMCKTLAAIVLIMQIGVFSGYASSTLFTGNVAALLGFALVFITSLTAVSQPHKQPISLVFFILYFVAYGVLNSWTILINLGWVKTSSMAIFGNITQAIFDGLIMFVMLQIRTRELQKEHHQLAISLQHSKETAEAEKQHREEQSQLFAMLAHELKTPLATLRMWMETDGLKREIMDRAIGDMNQVIERCVHTDQLADQGLEPFFQNSPLIALTNSCVQSCRYPERVDLIAPEALGSIHTDAQMLSIVLGNLLDNACKYSSPQSRIQLSLQRSSKNEEDGWLWQVRNQAGSAGLPDEARLFERYYRSPRARRMSGSGLGLFLVKGFLDLLQGTINYDVQEGQAVFSIWLPEQPSALR